MNNTRVWQVSCGPASFRLSPIRATGTRGPRYDRSPKWAHARVPVISLPLPVDEISRAKAACLSLARPWLHCGGKFAGKDR